MSTNKNNSRRSRATKRLIAFVAIALSTTLAVVTLSAPAAKATYGENNDTATTAQVSEEIRLDDIASEQEIAEVQGTQITEESSAEEGTPIDETSSEAESAISEKRNSTSSQTNKGYTGSTPKRRSSGSRSTKSYTDSTKKRSSNNSQKSSGSQKSGGGQKSSGNNGFTNETETRKNTTNTPVALSPTAPYYYNNVLSATEKKLYDLMLDGMRNVSAQISLGVNLSKKQIDNAFNAVVRDQSEIFWVGLAYTIRTKTTYSGNTATTTYTIEPSYTMSANQIPSAQAKLNGAVNQVLATLDGGMSEYDIELAVHDYIVKTVTYSKQAVRSPKSYPQAYTAYGALVEGSAVCEGYSKAFQLILNKVGIRTTLISGKTSNGSHMWNMANINGAWYHVDVTFDDPNNGTASAILRNNFNLTAAEIGKTHAIANRFSYPSANTTNKNYFNAEGLSFSAYGDKAANKLYNEVVRAVRNNKRVVQIRVGGSMNTTLGVLKNSNAKNGLSNIKACAQRTTGRTISSFTYSTDANVGVITIYLAA